MLGDGYALRILQDKVESRVSQSVRQKPDWPCRKGCDYCCRHLANVPEATDTEWRLVRQTVEQLSADQRSTIEKRILELECAQRHITCPFLDRAESTCLVYENRPIACRVYGYFMDRDQGLYCNTIKQAVDSGNFGEVVWGNAEWVLDAERRIGEKLNLFKWWTANH